MYEREESVGMAYNDADPREILSDVIDDLEEAQTGLRRALTRMIQSSLAGTTEYQELIGFIALTLQNAGIASDAARQRLDELEEP